MPATKTYKWSPISHDKVLGLVQSGRHSVRNITQIFNVLKSTAYNIKKCGTGQKKSQPSHLKLLDEMTMRRIEWHIKTNIEICRQSLAIIINLLHLTIAPHTVQQALHEHGYHFYVVRRHPLLKKIDMKRRLQFAKRWVHLSMQYWRHHI